MEGVGKIGWRGRRISQPDGGRKRGPDVASGVRAEGASRVRVGVIRASKNRGETRLGGLERGAREGMTQSWTPSLPSGAHSIDRFPWVDVVTSDL